MQLIKIDNIVYIKKGKKLYYLTNTDSGIVMVQIKEIKQ